VRFVWSIFASDRCRPVRLDVPIGPGNGTRSGTLYQVYKTWAGNSGFRPVSIKTFATRLENVGVDKAHCKDGEYYGLALPAPDDD
jgi:phage/plasmid-associated DNA primase